MILDTIERVARAIRTDGWENAILGIGGTKDPSAYTTFSARARLTDDALEALYVEDHFAARVIEALPKHALRAGWDLTVPGDPQAAAAIRSAYATREEELDVAAELAQGWCWGRLFGGALTWIGADDGLPSAMPLDEASIRSVRYLHTFDRRDVQIWRYYADPEHPKFRKPMTYMVRPLVQIGPGGGSFDPRVAGGIEIHESRCIVWGGVETTDRRRQLLQGWDDSVLERCWDALRQLAEDYAAKSMLLGRISQAVYKIKGLYDLIAGKKEEILRRRMGLMELSRSRARAIVLDTDEGYEQHTQSLSGVPETIQASTLRLASAVPMPVTILMGQSPAGMDATGDGDLETWDATTDADRQGYLRPRHERLARVILLAHDGPTAGKEPDAWAIAYRPLREPTRKEAAEIGKLETEADAIAIDRGIYSADHAAQRYAPGGGRVQLSEDEIRARIARRQQLAGQPPKDNAELGTLAPRSAEARAVLADVKAGMITRQSARAIFTTLHRLTPADADALLADVLVPGAPIEGPDPITPGSEWIDTEDGHRMRVTGINAATDTVYYVDLDSETPERQWGWKRASFLERCRPAEAPAAAPVATPPGPPPEPQSGQGAGAPQPPPGGVT